MVNEIPLYSSFNLCYNMKIVCLLADVAVAEFVGTDRLPDNRLFGACTERSPGSVGPHHSSGLDVCRPLHTKAELRACCTGHQATVAVVEVDMVAIPDWLVLLATG